MSRIHGWDSNSGVAAVVRVVASGGLMSVVVTVPGVEVRVGGVEGIHQRWSMGWGDRRWISGVVVAPPRPRAVPLRERSWV
jgi:hypothetical protein